MLELHICGEVVRKVNWKAMILILLPITILAPALNLQPAGALNSSNVATGLKLKSIDILFPLPEITRVGGYDWLKVENCSYPTRTGQPMLPVKTVPIKLPEGSTIIDLSVEVKESVLPGNYKVLPVPQPSMNGSQTQENFSEDPNIYNGTALFPEEWYVYRNAHGMDAETTTRVEYVILNIFALRFLPSEGKVIRVENVSVTVNYIETEIPTPPMELENLVITSPTLKPYAIELAEWKNSTGISSRVLDTNWIYHRYGGIDRQEQIRTCIKDFVATHGIAYVTLFGDADQVPVRYAYVPDGHDTYTPTDLYYADLDGTWDDNNDGLYADQRYDIIDGIPDVYVGRIPPSSTGYAEAVVTKIIEYKQTFDSSEDWANRVVLAAGTGYGGGGNDLGDTSTILKEYISGLLGNKTIVKLYTSAGTLDNHKLKAQIDPGCIFLNFAGHGNPDGWLLRWIIRDLWYELFCSFRNIYSPYSVDDLTNGRKLPVVTTMSCSTARFDDTDCIGEWFVLRAEGGAIAYFGATRIAWTYIDDFAPYGLMGEMDRRIYEAFNEGYTKLSQMWGVPITKYVQSHIPNYKYASKYDAKTLMEFVLLGDPTLRIYNPDYPETLKVPEDCPTIQGAINAAYDGDTILVSSGTYYENVVVNKSVSLVGENPVNTIVDGNGTGTPIHIAGTLSDRIDNASIRGFTVQNGGNNVGIHLFYANNCTISDNIVTNNRMGLYVTSSKGNLISSNTMFNNSYGTYLSFQSGGNILRNNNMTHNRYNFGVHSTSHPGTLADYIQDIDASNTVNGKPIYYWVNQRNRTVPADAGCAIVVNSTAITLRDLSLRNNVQGALLCFTTNSTVENVNFSDNRYGVKLEESNNILIMGNEIDMNDIGIFIWFSSSTRIYHNSFTNNTVQATSSGQSSVWDDGYPSSGNYWSDYTGVDLYRGPYQNETGSDGIGDAPYVIDVNNQDKYPLMKPNSWIKNTSMIFSLAPNPAYLEQTITLQGILEDEYNRPLIDTEVDILLDGILVAHLQTNSTGGFYATGKPGSAGTYQVEVSFKGSETLRPSSDTEILTILPRIDTQTIFELSPNPAKLGETITLTGNLTDQYDNPIEQAKVKIYYSIDDGTTWTYAGTLQTNSTGVFTAKGKLTILGIYLVKVEYEGDYMYKASHHVETLTIESP